jgi:hypothetical protein
MFSVQHIEKSSNH